MQHRFRFLLPLLVLAACSEDQPPTGPAESGDLAESHAPGHKVVNSLADPGNGVCNAAQCTLREAINDPASTEITFAAGLTGPITLARPGAGGGTLVIEKPLTITGPSSRVIIQRRSTDPAFRIVRIGSGGTVTLTNLTIRGGKPPGAVVNTAGGIINFGTLALANCTVAGNSAFGISSHQGMLALRNSRVAENSGGGLFSHQGTLTLMNSLVTSNSGRGVVSRGGTLELTRSTVSENSDAGVAIALGHATLTEARIVANNGGGIGVGQATVMLTNSTVARNSAVDGAGIFLGGGSSMAIVNSTVVGNSATGLGGGIHMFVPLRFHIIVALTNSTVSGNSAFEGAGLYLNSNADVGVAEARLTNSTVALNSATGQGGGIGNFGRLILTNSLVARNTASAGPDVFGEGGESDPVTARFSLIGDGTGSGITNTDGNQVGTAVAPIDPRLAPLANYGGSTQTHRLLLGSPAIDAASAADCPATDQRGVPRPQGAGCDIGSFERK